MAGKSDFLRRFFTIKFDSCVDGSKYINWIYFIKKYKLLASTEKNIISFIAFI